LHHLYLAGGAQAENYTAKRRGRTAPNPDRNRNQHSVALLASLNQALDAARLPIGHQPEAAIESSGFYLEFRLPRGDEDFADKLRIVVAISNWFR